MMEIKRTEGQRVRLDTLMNNAQNLKRQVLRVD